MDETPAYFDICPNRTVAVKGEKSIIVRTTGAEKRQLTVVLSCSANGGLLPHDHFQGQEGAQGDHCSTWIHCYCPAERMDGRGPDTSFHP